MHYWRILKVLFLCGLVDAVARSLAYWGSSDIIAGALYAFFMLIFVGDSFFYVLFAILFEVAANILEEYKQPVWVYMATGTALVIGLFTLFGSVRFFTSQQMVLMVIAYSVIGSLYGAFYWRWVLLRQFSKHKN